MEKENVARVLGIWGARVPRLVTATKKTAPVATSANDDADTVAQAKNEQCVNYGLSTELALLDGAGVGTQIVEMG